MNPLYEDEFVRLYHSTIEAALDAGIVEAVDAVITDPPYNVRAADIELAGRSPMRRDFGEWDEGFDPNAFLRLVAPVTRPGAAAIVFTSDRLVSLFEGRDGWARRGVVIWRKSNPAPSPRPGYVQAAEFVVWMARDGAASTWNGGGYCPNVIDVPVCSGLERLVDGDRALHPTQKPEAIVAPFVSNHTNAGDLVFDGFAGTGTTGVVCKRLERRAVLVEADERYARAAARRLAATLVQRSLF